MLTKGMGNLSFKGVERLIRGKGIFKCNPLLVETDIKSMMLVYHKQLHGGERED